MIRGWLARHPWVVPVAAVVALELLPAVAEARVGGGQSFGRSGRSSGGGSSGGSGGGGADLLFLLLQLVIRVPALGVPLVLALVAFVAYRLYTGGGGGAPTVHRTRQVEGPRALSGVPGLSALRERDPGFSQPVLIDNLVLVHQRAREAIGNGAWAALAPFVTDGAKAQLLEMHPGVREVSEVVVGGLRLLRVERRGEFDLLSVSFECTQLERLASGERRVDLTEQWTFRRAVGARSLAPEKVERLGCPNCGASIEVTPMGTCRNCDTPITAGQLAWQACFASLQSRKPATVPEVGFVAGGDEGSVHEPMAQDPQLPARMRELHARHPGFDMAVFGKRVELVYHELQSAWSDGKWERARPFVTDPMFQSLRFWVDRYARGGLRNRLDDVTLDRVVAVKVDVDAWYESITVRLWGSMKDSVVRADGKVVGGNPNTARRFSEYWTFLRAAGTDGDSHGASPNCPSCGAPLDQISMAGVCGYCGSKITTGKFDWVLARIDQPEVYRG
ncbi:MAG: TIM44-like domain-containing protein [Myxococcota bacterium]